MTYIELHAHSHYSLLDGASSPAALAARAASLGMGALALTDHDAVYGAVAFAEACTLHGVRPLFGAELTTTRGHLTLLVENEAGWRNLCALITKARQDRPKGEALLPFPVLEAHSAGLIALTGCREGVLRRALQEGEARRVIGMLRAWFGGGNLFVELQHHLLPGDSDAVRELAAFARAMKLDVVATNNVHYARREGHRLQDVLVATRWGMTLAESTARRRPNNEFYLKPGERLAPLFAEVPQALANTARIAERCTFALQFGLQTLPPAHLPEGRSACEHLAALCRAAIPARCPDTPKAARAKLAHELTIIRRAGLCNYLLLVGEVVAFARGRGIRCQGRGSAANSLVAYLLGISPIDPIAHNLVFERFLSDERRVVPDIDIDFDAARREEVIQHIYRRFGHEHAAMACTFVTYRRRSALRDVGKAFGIPAYLLRGVAGDEEQQAALRASPLWRQVFELAEDLRGCPRHLGIHNGGMVITAGSLTHHLPTEPARMADRTVVQWDKDSLEAAGLVKVDILGLRMLSVLSEAEAAVSEETGQPLNLDALPFDDPAVYALIGQADTVGVFQVESRAQQQVQPRLQPRTFADLVVSISLIRPGPIQGNMVHPYLRRRSGEEPVSYPHPLLIPALEETLGVLLYQEQVLKVAHDLAGLTPGQGEMLRRALGSKHGTALIDRLREAFLQGATSKGVDHETAAAVFESLRAFGSYSFPKSHAAAFAVLVYRSAWLKAHHPAPFYAALLNNQPMGFWPPAALVTDARRHGVQVLPVDVNRSGARTTAVGHAIRLGVNRVAGFGAQAAERLVAARGDDPFRDLDDLCTRTRLPRRLVEHLIRVGACDGWGTPRRQLLWALGLLRWEAPALDLPIPTPDVPLDEMTRSERLAEEYGLLGLSAGDHALALLRPQLDARGVLTSRALNACRSGEVVRVAGLLVVHQAPPTAKGIRFLTLEDEYGLINTVVKPPVYERFWRLIRGEAGFVVSGRVERRGSVVNVVAHHLEGLG